MNAKSSLFKMPNMTEQEYLDFYGLLLSIVDELDSQFKSAYVVSAFSVIDLSQLTENSKEKFYDFFITPLSYESMAKKIGLLSEEKRLFVYSRIFTVISTRNLNEQKEHTLSKMRTYLNISKEYDIEIRNELSEVRKISPLSEAIKGAAVGGVVGRGGIGVIGSGLLRNFSFFSGPPGWVLVGIGALVGGVAAYWWGKQKAKNEAEEEKKEQERRAQIVIKRLQETIDALSEKLKKLEEKLTKAEGYKELYEKIKRRIDELLASKHNLERDLLNQALEV